MQSQASSVVEAHVLLSGLVVGESPRWHEDRLWFAHWGTGEIVAVDAFRHAIPSEAMATHPANIP